MTWQPSASFEILRQRAQILIKIREFFNQRNYLEVETPALARFGVTDVYLDNIKATFRGQNYCLQTSPEYHMKRLLAAGSGPIYQLARAYRDDELGRWHNPEFTMLEWYQLGIDHHALMEEMDDLLQLVLCCPPLIKKTYREVFLEICNLDPFLAKLGELQQTLETYNLDNVLSKNEQDRDQYLFLLMSHVVEPAFANNNTPLAIYNFPPSQAALSKVNKGVAERFEIYHRGIELANGFHELTDAEIQLARFSQDRILRQQKGLPSSMPDEFLLDALAYGLPPCSGVALGVDRLVALALHQNGLSNVLAFDFSRA
jgi:elongation factor P--(R)-beta-lysine ligase